MKKGILSVIMMLAATILVAVMPTEAEAAIYDDTLRLHILANSDSEEDQALKLLVRDAVLLEFSSELKCDSKEEAQEKISELLPKIESFAEDEISRHGYDYSVTATLGDEWFDTREYEGFSMPRGEYSSLIIKIGEAKGKNWWCVMFPPMCLDIACEDMPEYTKEESNLIKNSKYTVKFKVLELLSDAFKR